MNKTKDYISLFTRGSLNDIVGHYWVRKDDGITRITMYLYGNLMPIHGQMAMTREQQRIYSDSAEYSFCYAYTDDLLKHMHSEIARAIGFTEIASWPPIEKPEKLHIWRLGHMLLFLDMTEPHFFEREEGLKFANGSEIQFREEDDKAEPFRGWTPSPLLEND